MEGVDIECFSSHVVGHTVSVLVTCYYGTAICRYLSVNVVVFVVVVEDDLPALCFIIYGN